MKITKTSGAIIIFISGCIISFFGVGMFDAGTELGAIGIIVMLIVFGLFLSGLYFAFAHYLSPKWTFWVTLSILFILNFKFIYANRDRNVWAEKYDVSTEGLDSLFISHNDTTVFNNLKRQLSKHFYPGIQKQIVYPDTNGFFNSKGKKINATSDTVTEYTVDNIAYNKDKRVIIYFITYLDFLQVHKNDSLKGYLQLQTAGGGIITVKFDDKYNWWKQNVPMFSRCGIHTYMSIYDEIHIDSSSYVIKDIRKSLEKFLIVDFHYGSASFWDDIMVKKS